jgi:hypothetical protein
LDYAGHCGTLQHIRIKSALDEGQWPPHRRHAATPPNMIEVMILDCCERNWIEIAERQAVGNNKELKGN